MVSMGKVVGTLGEGEETELAIYSCEKSSSSRDAWATWANGERNEAVGRRLETMTSSDTLTAMRV